MVPHSKSITALVLRLIVGLALLGCPITGSAAGTWSVISRPQQLGYVVGPSALAADAGGNLYVVDYAPGTIVNRIQKRDAQGNWSVIATIGSALGQVDILTALAVDTAGNLYVADDRWDYASQTYPGRIQRQDVQGNWSVIAAQGTGRAQGFSYSGLAVDTTGDLYVADTGNNRVLEYAVSGSP